MAEGQESRGKGAGRLGEDFGYSVLFTVVLFQRWRALKGLNSI